VVDYTGTAASKRVQFEINFDMRPAEGRAERMRKQG
jgi:hypothetical protein